MKENFFFHNFTNFSAFARWFGEKSTRKAIFMRREDPLMIFRLPLGWLWIMRVSTLYRTLTASSLYRNFKNPRKCKRALPNSLFSRRSHIHIPHHPHDPWNVKSRLRTMLQPMPEREELCGCESCSCKLMKTDIISLSYHWYIDFP